MSEPFVITLPTKDVQPLPPVAHPDPVRRLTTAADVVLSLIRSDLLLRVCQNIETFNAFVELRAACNGVKEIK